MSKLGWIMVAFAALVFVGGVVLVALGDKAIGASTISAAIGLGTGTSIKAHKEPLRQEPPLRDGGEVKSVEVKL